MFNWIFGSRQALFIAGASAVCVIAVTGCGSSEETVVRPTPQGTIELSLCKVGLPESTFKDAILTFIPDVNGSIQGKNQYLSRGKDPQGGQYVVQCRGDRCYELSVVYTTPVPKATAVSTDHQLLPDSVPAQSKDDDSQINKSATPMETIYFGNDYKTEITYADKAGTQVSSVNAWYQPKEEASAATPH